MIWIDGCISLGKVAKTSKTLEKEINEKWLKRLKAEAECNKRMREWYMNGYLKI